MPKKPCSSKNSKSRSVTITKVTLHKNKVYLLFYLHFVTFLYLHSEYLGYVIIYSFSFFLISSLDAFELDLGPVRLRENLVRLVSSGVLRKIFGVRLDHVTLG